MSRTTLGLAALVLVACQGSVAGTSGNTATGAGGGGSPAICQSPVPPLIPGEIETPQSGAAHACSCPCLEEAPANLQRIAAAAIAAYEGHGSLCATAIAWVPATPPPASCYQPLDYPGSDFYSDGDTGTFGGWECLGVGPFMTKVIRCSYFYNAGEPDGLAYLGPPRGGPDPGPDGFEVSAVGDFHGTSVWSNVITIAGTKDAVGVYTLSPVFVSNPSE
jgi:hypothetical protein